MEGERGVSCGEVEGERAHFVDRDHSVGGLRGLGCCVRRHRELQLSNEGSIDSLKCRMPFEMVVWGLFDVEVRERGSDLPRFIRR